MGLLPLLLAVAFAQPAEAVPLLWLNPKGKLFIAGRESHARLGGAAKTIETPVGLGLDFPAGKSGFLIPDFPVLHLTRAMTVSTWIFVRNYAPNGQQSQVLFRGDDRSGLDPYHLSISSDGKIHFAIDSSDGGQSQVLADIPLKTWIRVTGSYDEETGEMRMYLGSRLIETKETSKHPISELKADSAPGIGIGNVQNDHGPHNQPMDGIVADLRLYDVALDPKAAGYSASILKSGG